TWSRLWGNFAGLASSDEHGRKDPNVERYFDVWFMPYTAHYPEESTGVLNTDRPHQVKFYGAYSLEFGLTVGANFYAMSGTPVSTDFELNNIQGFYPEGRADQGRTPFLWRGDLYAEYNIKVTEAHTIQVNMNIHNLTNNRIAQRVWNRYNRQTIYLSNEEIKSGFDYRQVSEEEDLLLDPRYMKEFYFQSPISLRLGVKFIF
ncbi:hypothetical protein KGY73_11585, partial [bacterium]|nr:hypothetical protein [bacterium]